MSIRSRIIDGVRLALAKVQSRLEQPTAPAMLALAAPAIAPAVIDTRKLVVIDQPVLVDSMSMIDGQINYARS